MASVIFLDPDGKALRRQPNPPDTLDPPPRLYSDLPATGGAIFEYVGFGTLGYADTHVYQQRA